MPAAELTTFLHALRRSPREVGAIAPSSPRLATRLAAVIPSRRSCTVVELGGGTGAVTTQLQARINGESRLIVVERDPQLATRLEAQYPRADVANADARALRSLLCDKGIEGADAIICGLPWSLFSVAERADLLSAIRESLAPGGVFTTFAYKHTMVLPRARRFHVELQQAFDEVLPTRTILRNFPPAMTYVCRRPVETR